MIVVLQVCFRSLGPTERCLFSPSRQSTDRLTSLSGTRFEDTRCWAGRTGRRMNGRCFTSSNESIVSAAHLHPLLYKVPPTWVPGLFMSEQKDRLIAGLKAPRIDCLLYGGKKELLDGAQRDPSSFDTAVVGFEI